MNIQDSYAQPDAVVVDKLMMIEDRRGDVVNPALDQPNRASAWHAAIRLHQEALPGMCVLAEVRVFMYDDPHLLTVRTLAGHQRRGGTTAGAKLNPRQL